MGGMLIAIVAIVAIVAIDIIGICSHCLVILGMRGTVFVMVVYRSLD